MEELALHILDLAENSIAAGARRVRIAVRQSTARDTLSIEIADNGPGMDAEMLRKAADPFFTTRTTRRVGLGLSLFEQAARAAGGEFRLESSPGAGTTVSGTFRNSHPDRQPLGDIASTLLALVTGSPQVEFEYMQQTDDFEVVFRSRDILDRLGAEPVNSPRGIAMVRKFLRKLSEANRAVHC